MTSSGRAVRGIMNHQMAMHQQPGDFEEST